VFGYGSLIWNPGFAHDARLVGFVRDYHRVFYQGNRPPAATAPVPHLPLISFVPSIYPWFCSGRRTGSTDHRGTPEFPGRTVTLEHQPGATCVRPLPLLHLYAPPFFCSCYLLRLTLLFRMCVRLHR
jgi:gamma-glutamylcyclotransferase, plant